MYVAEWRISGASTYKFGLEGGPVHAARQELASVLREARLLLALPGMTSHGRLGGALTEMDGVIATLEADWLPSRLTVSVLFAPTGPIQEVGLSSEWADEFLALAARCDTAIEVAYLSPL